eukprot:7198590-Alexandrium_andersonii.AAC.1
MAPPAPWGQHHPGAHMSVLQRFWACMKVLQKPWSLQESAPNCSKLLQAGSACVLTLHFALEPSCMICLNQPAPKMWATDRS